MTVGTMTLQRFNGAEIFSVGSASVAYLTDEEDRYVITFRADADEIPIQTLPDTEVLHAHPFAEITLRLTKHPGAALLTGRSYFLPRGYDDASGEYLTNFYYFEHEVMDDIEINVVKRHMDHAQLCITGTTTDVNYYDGSKPATRVLIDAEFTLKFAQE
jgi:hypothetical protein